MSPVLADYVTVYRVRSNSDRDMGVQYGTLKEALQAIEATLARGGIGSVVSIQSELVLKPVENAA